LPCGYWKLTRDCGRLLFFILMRCPTCEREFQPAESTALPFCSERCRTIDLGRWLDEGYVLPEVTEVEDEEPSGGDSNDG
jgi:uncharacterized protein